MVVVPETSCILRNYETTWVQRLFAKLLCGGPMPKHVAFIMDGNRRFAREQNLPNVWEGHQLGGEKMQQVANMLIDLGVQEMTTFSFSTENYKRPAEEVNALMQMVTERSGEWLDGMDELRELGVHAEIVGSWNKIQSAEMKSLFAKTSILSKEHKKLKFHLAFAYSAQDEICEGVNTLVSGLEDGSLNGGDLDESLFEQCLSLYHNNNPIDILVRTSGDYRLSDFQLWQASSAYLDFVKVTWPEYGYWDLLRGIWQYQYQVTFLDLPNGNGKNEKDNNANRQKMVSSENLDARQEKQRKFVEKFRENKWEFIKRQIIE